MMENAAQQIDLNQATVEQLSALPGIGHSLSQRIITYRETVRPFEEVIELTAVPGVSERMVERFRDRLTIIPVVSEGGGAVDEDAGSERSEAEMIVTELLGEEPIQPEPESAAEPDSDLPETSEQEADSESETEEEDELTFGTESEEENEFTAEIESDEDVAADIPLPIEGPVSPVGLVAPDDSLSPDDPKEEQPAHEDVEPMEPEIPPDEGVREIDHMADVPPPPTADFEPETAASGLGSLETPEQTRATPAPERDRGARRRGCIVLILGGILGAVVGTALTLAIIASLNNGALSFSQADARLERELNDARQEQTALMDRLETIESQLGTIAASAQETAEQQANSDRTIADLQQEISGVERDMSRLEDATVEFEERLASVSAAAETFEAFLDRLRDLLFDFQGPPPTPIPTPTTTKTPSPVPTATPVQEEAPTLEASPENEGAPTRTPRPTATRFPIATGTPEPQP